MEVQGNSAGACAPLVRRPLSRRRAAEVIPQVMGMSHPPAEASKSYVPRRCVLASPSQECAGRKLRTVVSPRQGSVANAHQSMAQLRSPFQKKLCVTHPVFLDRCAMHMHFVSAQASNLTQLHVKHMSVYEHLQACSCATVRSQARHDQMGSKCSTPKRRSTLMHSVACARAV
jgi:hypothetical protein